MKGTELRATSIRVLDRSACALSNEARDGGTGKVMRDPFVQRRKSSRLPSSSAPCCPRGATAAPSVMPLEAAGGHQRWLLNAGSACAAGRRDEEGAGNSEARWTCACWSSV